MDYRKLFLAEPGKRIKLSKIDPDYHGKHITEKQADAETAKHSGIISTRRTSCTPRVTAPC